jgi:hypothetical protein
MYIGCPRNYFSRALVGPLGRSGTCSSLHSLDAASRAALSGSKIANGTPSIGQGILGGAVPLAALRIPIRRSPLLNLVPGI